MAKILGQLSLPAFAVHVNSLKPYNPGKFLTCVRCNSMATPTKGTRYVTTDTTEHSYSSDT